MTSINAGDDIIKSVIRVILNPCWPNFLAPEDRLLAWVCHKDVGHDVRILMPCIRTQYYPLNLGDYQRFLSKRNDE